VSEVDAEPVDVAEAIRAHMRKELAQNRMLSSVDTETVVDLLLSKERLTADAVLEKLKEAEDIPDADS